MSATSISLTPIRKTTADRTALGRYWSGFVEEQQHDRDDDGGRQLRDLGVALRLVDHLGLGRAAVDHERAAEAGREVRNAEPDEVGVLDEALPVLDGVGPEVAALWARITRNIEAAVGSESDASLQVEALAGSPGAGRPLGTGPRIDTPCALEVEDRSSRRSRRRRRRDRPGSP